MTSNGKQFTVTREMLTAVARDGWNHSAVFKFCFCFALLYNKSLNNWSLGEQSLSVKCYPQMNVLILQHNYSYQQQLFSELPSPQRSHYTNYNYCCKSTIWDCRDASYLLSYNLMGNHYKLWEQHLQSTKHTHVLQLKNLCAAHFWPAHCQA